RKESEENAMKSRMDEKAGYTDGPYDLRATPGSHDAEVYSRATGESVAACCRALSMGTPRKTLLRCATLPYFGLRRKCMRRLSESSLTKGRGCGVRPPLRRKGSWRASKPALTSAFATSGRKNS